MDVKLPSGTVTFLTTDIVGFSQRFEADPNGTRALAIDHLNTLGALIHEEGGFVFKTVGDAIWAAFQSAPDAVRCAARIQSAIQSQTEIELKIAILTGEANPIAGDYLEKVVNRCSRLCTVCEAGAVILGASTFELVRDDFKFIYVGKVRLKGVPDHDVWQLWQEGEGPRPHRHYSCRHSIPATDRAFVGRREELSSLKIALASNTRLLTITGIGGIGKTTLARQLALECLDAFKDGVVYVDCESLADSFEIAAMIANQFSPGAGIACLDDLVTLIGDSRLLVVLDCFENLVHERLLVDTLASQTTSVQLVVTSRKLLGLQRETEFPLGPMDSTKEALDDAQSLFWDAARQVTRELQPTKSNLAVSRRIVAALECIPLAIVLAASRLRYMAPQELLEQLETRRLTVLKRSSSTPSDRHQNLSRVIGDSFNLLPPNEQSLLASLSAFRGFFLQDALAVLGDDDFVIEGLAALRDNSLVSSSIVGGRTRYRILDTVREYIQLREESPQLTSARSGHAEHYAKLALAIRRSIDDGQWKAGSSLIWLEMGNFREAIRAAVSEGNLELVRALASALLRPLAEAGLGDDFEMLRQACNMLPATDYSIWIEIKGLEGIDARRRGDNNMALFLWRQRADLCREIGDLEHEADILTDIAHLAIEVRDFKLAEASLARFDDICSPQWEEGGLATAGCILKARIALAQGRAEDAKSLSETALVWYRSANAGRHRIHISSQLADILAELGNATTAQSLLMQGLNEAAAGNYPKAAARLLFQLAKVSIECGNTAAALQARTVFDRLPKGASRDLQSAMKEILGEVPSQPSIDTSEMVDWMTACNTLSNCCGEYHNNHTTEVFDAAL